MLGTGAWLGWSIWATGAWPEVKAEGAEAGSRDLPGVRQAGLEVWEGQLPPEGSVARRQLTSPASHPSSGLADEGAEG